MTTLTLTVVRCAGLIQRDPSPLAVQPLRVLRFGTEAQPLEREFIPASEVDALLGALAPHVARLVAYSAGTDSPHIEDSRKTLSGVFAAPPPEAPAPLVTA